MSTLLGQALVLGNQVVRFLPWRCLYPWVLGFLTGSCYNGCMMLSECGCSHNEGRCIKDASIGLGFQVALFLPWLRQHGSTRHRGANVGLGIQMVFFVCSLLVFLSHGVCKSPYISIHRALQQRYCHAGEGGKTKKEEWRVVKQKRGGEGGKTKKGGGEGGKTKKEGRGGW